MKTFHLLGLLLIFGLIFSCSKEKSDGPIPKPNLEKIVGKYQLPPEESVRRNEKRLWTISKADDSHVKIVEDLTIDADGKNPKITSRIFDNVTVKEYESGITFLRFDGLVLKDSDFTVNGHKNYIIYGNGSVQPNVIHATLHAKDLNSEDVIPFSNGLLELIKLD
ncbi:hypothetical protein LXM25_12665 [Dyadobacter sp. LJ53]|uniref:hypothetical protein n=1 Tax=Dyadobacter chenwenxiniae TaxID=2906456 RepID=UPI001F1F1AB1|nr:hypothetical protein [Dyadobacter chenwenxiniae]MCF0050917.1 hypothetical protein [Dyadobacter chenwenxiniae]